LKAIEMTVLAEKQPLTLFVRNRTVAKVDSIGFVVRRSIQLSHGRIYY